MTAYGSAVAAAERVLLEDDKQPITPDVVRAVLTALETPDEAMLRAATELERCRYPSRFVSREDATEIWRAMIDAIRSASGPETSDYVGVPPGD